MTPTLSPNARLAADVFAEVAKGNGAPFWEACHDDLVWRTIGTGSWSGEFRGKQAIVRTQCLFEVQRSLTGLEKSRNREVDHEPETTIA